MYTIILVLALLLTGSMCQEQPCYDMILQEVGSNYPQCASNARAAENGTFEDIFRDLICDPTCGPLYNATFYSLCPSPSMIDLLVNDYYLVQCRVNANGRACYSFYSTNDSNVELDMSLANNEAIQLCSSSAQGTCSDQCRDRLVAIKNYYGVCGSSLYNSTYFRAFNIINITSVFEYQLWTNCGVPVPVTGGGDTVTTPNDGMQPTSSAMQPTGSAMQPTSSHAMTCLKVQAAIMLAVLCAILAVSITVH